MTSLSGYDRMCTEKRLENIEVEIKGIRAGLLSPKIAAKLTYGPLTEEMVAEALISVANKWRGEHPLTDPAAMQKSLAVDEARFVLRLLDQIHNIEEPYGHRPDDIHSWLLDLARQP